MEETAAVNAVDPALARSMVEPLYRDLTLPTGESAISHADGVASIMRLVRDDPDLVVYTRKNEAEKLIVVANFHGGTVAMPAVDGMEGAELVCSSYVDADEAAAELRPYEARMYLVK